MVQDKRWAQKVSIISVSAGIRALIKLMRTLLQVQIESSAAQSIHNMKGLGKWLSVRFYTQKNNRQHRD